MHFWTKIGLFGCQQCAKKFKISHFLLHFFKQHTKTTAVTIFILGHVCAHKLILRKAKFSVRRRMTSYIFLWQKESTLGMDEYDETLTRALHHCMLQV